MILQQVHVNFGSLLVHHVTMSGGGLSAPTNLCHVAICAEEDMTLFHENLSLGLVYIPAVNVEKNLKAGVQHRLHVLVSIVVLQSRNLLSTLNSIVLINTNQYLTTSTTVTNAMGWVAVPPSKK